MRLRSLLFIAAAAGATLTTLVFSQPKTSSPTLAPAASPVAANSQVERGRYLTEVGDCVACHTPQGAARFSGGRPLQTPFGTVLSANLTPDQATGIGRYTPDTFYRALHEGIDHDGKHLYPAFPYDYYTQVTREDSDAIYAYLKSVPPVNHSIDRNQLPFPFNIRALMTVWNWLFLHEGPYEADTSKPADWNRGAYLVEGLGHCQACHTPRNFMGGARHGQAFQGGRFGNWFAPDITPNTRTGLGHWSRPELLEFLREGRNVHSAASGEMGEVVAFSTSQMNDADLNAVVAYLGDRKASPAIATTAPDAEVMKQGEAIWQDACSACHRMEGQGAPRYIPPLKADANLQQLDPTTVIHFILAGARKVPTARAPSALSMPAFNWKLDDSQVAAVATYARNSWGNAAPAVTAKQVADLRHALEKDSAQHRDAARPTSSMARPGPATLGSANTDSRDNGGAQAGRVVAPDAGGSAVGGPSMGGPGPQPQEKGHPGGVSTGGPG